MELPKLERRGEGRRVVRLWGAVRRGKELGPHLPDALVSQERAPLPADSSPPAPQQAGTSVHNRRGDTCLSSALTSVSRGIHRALLCPRPNPGSESPGPEGLPGLLPDLGAPGRHDGHAAQVRCLSLGGRGAYPPPPAPHTRLARPRPPPRPSPAPPRPDPDKPRPPGTSTHQPSPSPP